MPKVTPQTPRPKLLPSRASTTDAWDLVESFRVLLYGSSGTGKTTWWGSIPGRTLAFICSGGSRPGELRSINTPENRKRIRAEVITDSERLQELLKEAAEYDNVVLDHVSGLQDLLLKEILGLVEIPAQKSWGLAAQQQYGQCTLQSKEYLRAMLNLPGNVVIVAQERTFGGRDEGMDPDIIKPTVGAAVTPSLAGWLNPACDYVLQTFKRPKVEEVTRTVAGKETTVKQRTNKIEYCLRCEPHEVFMTKFRVPKGSRTIPDVITDPSWAKFLKVANG